LLTLFLRNVNCKSRRCSLTSKRTSLEMPHTSSILRDDSETSWSHFSCFWLTRTCWISGEWRRSLAELCKSLRALKLGSAIFNKETRTVWYVLIKRINKEKEVSIFRQLAIVSWPQQLLVFIENLGRQPILFKISDFEEQNYEVSFVVVRTWDYWQQLWGPNMSQRKLPFR